MAQFNLGVHYGNGEGVTKDSVRAYMWFTLASESGIASAIKSRMIIEKRMTIQQIGQAQQMARDCQQHKFNGCY